MTKRELMIRLEAFNDDEQIVFVQDDMSITYVNRLAHEDTVRTYNDAKKHIEILGCSIEREQKKYYHKEENRQKKINKLYDNVQFWVNKLNENIF